LCGCPAHFCDVIRILNLFLKIHYCFFLQNFDYYIYLYACIKFRCSNSIWERDALTSFFVPLETSRRILGYIHSAGDNRYLPNSYNLISRNSIMFHSTSHNMKLSRYTPRRRLWRKEENIIFVRDLRTRWT
jgi:hypothetical protein